MKSAADNFYRARTRKGAAMGALVLLAALLCVCLIGMLGVDIGHNASVRTQLQNATDAAALAGAQDFINSATYNKAETDALATAESNTADGKAVSNSTPHTLVTVQTQLPAANGTQPGVCQVDSQMTISNIFARLIGHKSDAINATATAVGYQSVTGIGPNTLFPLAVSVDTLNGHTIPLYKNKIGDSVTFYINSQQYKNAAYTGFTNVANANYINGAIDQALGLSPVQSGFIPEINMGTPINLMNGIAGTKDISGGAEYGAITNGSTLILPLISGDPPYNQSRKVVGFIGLKVTKVVRDNNHGQEEIITATITKAISKGTPGPVGSPTGNPAVDAGIQYLSPGKVQLSTNMLNNGMAN